MHSKAELILLIAKIEAAHFRTVEDTGANPCAMIVMNALRKEAGFSPLSTSDLPAYDETENTYVRPVSSNLVGHRLLEILTWKL